MRVHQLSKADARRIAVRAQLLDRRRPADPFEVVRHLTGVQLDQTAAVAPSADLVLWSRLGSAYDSVDVADAISEQRLIDLRGIARPAEDLVLYRAEMAQWPGRGELRPWQEEVRDWVADNNGCRLDILERLRRDGPLPASAFPDTCVRPWRSSGWTNHRNVVKMLDLLCQRGEVAVADRNGRERLWDLASRVYPDDPPVPVDEARRIRSRRRLRALGIAQARHLECPESAGEPAVIEGVKGRWRVDPEQLGQPFAGRAALLSPLDRLVFDRRRLLDVFGFDYQLEMYKPAAKRRWGYFALPILYGDRLVGKLDACSDREAGVFWVNAVHQDVPFSRAMAAAVDREIEDLARWLRLKPVRA